MSNTLNKTLELFDVFLEADKPLSAMDAAKALEMSRSNMHKYLSTLKDYQYLHYIPADKKYTLGLKFYELARSVQKNLKVDTVARPFMEELHAKTGELIVLMAPQFGKAYSVATVGVEQSGYMYTMSPGHCLPLYAGAVSLVLLAHHENAFIENYLKNTTLQKITPNTVVAENIIRRRIKTIREQGYIYTDHEVNPGGRAMAAPVFNSFGEIVASLGLTGPLYSMVDEKIDIYAMLVKEYATKITAELCGNR